MKRLMESLRNSGAGGDGVSLLGGFFLMGDGILVSSLSSLSSLSSRPLLDFSFWLAKVVEVLISLGNRKGRKEKEKEKKRIRRNLRSRKGKEKKRRKKKEKKKQERNPHQWNSQ